MAWLASGNSPYDLLVAHVELLKRVGGVGEEFNKAVQQAKTDLEEGRAETRKNYPGEPVPDYQEDEYYTSNIYDHLLDSANSTIA